MRHFVAGLALLALLTATNAGAQAPPAAPADEPLTAANLERLRTITQSSNKTASLDAAVVKTLGLGKDGDTITVKQFRAETAIGLYVFTIVVKPPSDRVVFSFRDPSGVTYNYLSDHSRTLKAAMSSDADGIRTLPPEEADAGFQSALKAWGQIARRVKFP